MSGDRKLIMALTAENGTYDTSTGTDTHTLQAYVPTTLHIPVALVKYTDVKIPSWRGGVRAAGRPPHHHILEAPRGERGLLIIKWLLKRVLIYHGATIF